MINNPVDLAPILEQIQSALGELQQVQTLVQSQSNSTQTQLDSVKSDVLQELVTQTNEIDSILSSLTTVNGQLDNNVTAINTHTSEKHSETQSAVNDEIKRTSAGSLYALLSSVINSARDNVKSHVSAVVAGTQVVKSVQRGVESISLSGSQNRTRSFSIAPVNMDKSVCSFYVSDGDRFAVAGGKLESSTRGVCHAIADDSSISGYVEVAWEVIEYA